MRGLRGHRRGFATLACLLWLLGVEALPAVHLATHDGHHTHAADGSIVATDHDDVPDHEDVDFVAIDAEGHAQPITAFDHDIHAHAANGLAHHAVALQQPAAPLLAPLPVTPPALPVVAIVPDQVSSMSVARPTARGPPAADA
jgi:hypothetical protein